MSDLISRQWLMECIDEGWIKFDTEKDANTYIHLIRDIAPSAQPEVPDISVEIEAEYKKWVGVSYIRKPLAKALYEVWKKHDKEDAERRSDDANANT